MPTSTRRNRCDTVLALIDECLADHERSTTAARTNRPHRNHQEVLQ